MVCVQTATYVSAPYFTPYMLKELALPYSSYVVLLAVAFVAKAMALPRIGHIAHRFGAKSILWVGGSCIVPTAALWTFSSALPYLITIQILGGIVWACYELATILLLFERIPDDMRTSVLTTFNFANTLGIVCGSLFGGWLIRLLGTDQSAYFVLFLVSSAARLLTLPLLSRVVNVPQPPTAPIAPTSTTQSNSGTL
jgi:MFS family permease